MAENEVQGAATLLVARYAIRIGDPLVYLIVVRYLGPEDFGLYAAAIAVTSLLVLISEFGVQQTVLDLGAVEESDAARVLQTGLAIGGLFGIGTILLLGLWFLLIDYPDLVAVLGMFLAIRFLVYPVLAVLTAGLQLRNSFSSIAKWNISVAGGKWIGTFAAIAANAGLIGVVVWPLALEATGVGIMLVAVGRVLNMWPLRIPKRDEIVGFVRQCWQYGTASSLHQVYHRSDAAIMSATRAPLETGHYVVGFRIIELANMLPGVLFNQILYPKYFYWRRTDRTRLRRYYVLTTKLMIGLGFIAAVLVALFSSELVWIVFGEPQRQATAILLVMAWGVPLRFWASAPGAVLTTDGLILRKIRIQGGVAVLNVVANILLIPRFGGVAAAAVMIISEAVLLSLYLLVVGRGREFRIREHIAEFVWFLIPAAVVVTAFAIGVIGMSLPQRVLTAAIACGVAAHALWMATRTERASKWFPAIW